MKKGDIVIHTLTGARVKIISIETDGVLKNTQAKCKVLKSAIREDIGKVFEYDVAALVHKENIMPRDTVTVKVDRDIYKRLQNDKMDNPEHGAISDVIADMYAQLDALIEAARQGGK
jgi:5'(3')-deoxyribonucleotidase